MAQQLHRAIYDPQATLSLSQQLRSVDLGSLSGWDLEDQELFQAIVINSNVIGNTMLPLESLIEGFIREFEDSSVSGRLAGERSVEKIPTKHWFGG